MNKKLIFNLIGLVIAVALIIFFIIPYWNSIGNLKKSIERDNAEIERLEELLSKTKWLDEEYKEVEEEAKKVFLSLPKEKDVPNLIVQFEELAAVNGLVLESIQFGTLEKDSDKKTGAATYENDLASEAEMYIASQDTSSKKSLFRSLPVTISVSGTYSSFKNYLNSLENNIRSMNVSEISFGGSSGSSSSETSGSSDAFEFDINLSVYYQ